MKKNLGKEFWSIDKLKLWDKNPRSITAKDFTRLKKQLQKLGAYKPLIITPDGTVIGGNMRLRALQTLGHKEAWVSIVNPKTEAEKIEIALSDNDRVGQYDEDALAELIYSFKDTISLADYKVDLKMPYGLDDLISNYAPDSEKDDVVPEPRKTDIKIGDIFTLGEHRLMCGDSTKKADVEKLMAGEKADCVFTDPPYGVDYGEKNRFLNSFQPSGRNLKDIANDMLGKDELLDFLVKVFTLANEHGEDHCSYYVTAPQNGELGLMMMMMMMMSGLPIRHVLIWNKNRQNFSLGRLDYEYKHEPILFTWKKTHNFYGNGQFKSSVWDIAKEQKCDIHPTMKPVALIENALLNSTKAGEICLDFFGGSGSTLIACEKLNRKCRMMEIDPLYCDVIVKRWENFTNKKAKKA